MVWKYRSYSSFLNLEAENIDVKRWMVILLDGIETGLAMTGKSGSNWGILFFLKEVDSPLCF